MEPERRGFESPEPPGSKEEVFFDYHLPKELIAQEPCSNRDQSRLLLVRRASGLIEHHVFRELPDLLDRGDLIILNDTRVLPARLRGRTQSTGGKWEGLFLGADADDAWEVLSRSRARLEPGDTIIAGRGLALTLIKRTGPGRWIVHTEPRGSFEELLAIHGSAPLPPYIRKGQARASDEERYQTVYARRAGAIAAPTAGLHFTPELFANLRQERIGYAFVTLHIGMGTFQPIQCSDFRQHPMHRERGWMPAITASAIDQARRRGGRIVAVGTTAVRVLETASTHAATQAWSGETDLFIYPPYAFRSVDALITNFHLPRSTLLLLTSAFGGSDLIRQAYAEAIKTGYRFYSYGDAMLIV
jgi:S-adenosylmethionine:tRNA ribosyltransferase-isomerase